MNEYGSSTDLKDVVPVLDDMQDRGVIGCFAIGGAFAAILRNEPISTVDLDIFFAFDSPNASPILSLAPIYDYARDHGYPFDHEFIDINGWLVQFVEVSENPLWVEALENAENMAIGSIKCRVIEADYLIAMWLLAGRPKDYHKIALFVESKLFDAERFEKILVRHELMVKWQKEKWRFIEDEWIND